MRPGAPQTHGVYPEGTRYAPSYVWYFHARRCPEGIEGLCNPIICVICDSDGKWICVSYRIAGIIRWQARGVESRARRSGRQTNRVRARKQQH